MATFTEEQGEILSGRIGELVDVLRTEIAAKSGNSVDPADIRVMRQELRAAVHEAALAKVPTDARELVGIQAREPKWLAADIPEDDGSGRSVSISGALRGTLAEAIASATSQAQYRAYRDQFAGMDFAALVDAVRATLDDVRSVDPAVAERIEDICERQSAAVRLPTSRSLLGPMGQARGSLVKAARLGDRDKLRTVRALLELGDFIDASGYQVDRTHIPPVGPKP